MRIAEARASTVSDLWTQIQARVGNSQHLENAAQELATALHTQFDESVVIARVFVTVPFAALPKSNKDFVRKLAESAGANEDLKAGTPVLSLIGTHGQEEDWDDRRKSKGHVGIPLISSSFVGTIPMIGPPFAGTRSPSGLGGQPRYRNHRTNFGWCTGIVLCGGCRPSHRSGGQENYRRTGLCFLL